jgi:hypothetical protein
LMFCKKLILMLCIIICERRIGLSMGINKFHLVNLVN